MNCHLYSHSHCSECWVVGIFPLTAKQRSRLFFFICSFLCHSREIKNETIKQNEIYWMSFCFVNFCLFHCQSNSMPNVHWQVYIVSFGLTFNECTHENSLFYYLIENNSSFVRYLVYLFIFVLVIVFIIVPIANARHSNLLFQHFDWSASIPELNGLWKDKVCFQFKLFWKISYSSKSLLLHRFDVREIHFDYNILIGRSTLTYIHSFGCTHFGADNKNHWIRKRMQTNRIIE